MVSTGAEIQILVSSAMSSQGCRYGGWHDCGDHLKEAATMSYAAAILGLAAAAFSDRDADVYSANQGITQVTDGIPDILYEAKHGADFILRSYDKAGGQVGNMITSIGGFGDNGSGQLAEDHMWWGRPENQDKMPAARGGPPRPARIEPTTDYLGKYAANLAFVSKLIRPYDSAYADRCLKAAKLFMNLQNRGRTKLIHRLTMAGLMSVMTAHLPVWHYSGLPVSANILMSSVMIRPLVPKGWIITRNYFRVDGLPTMIRYLVIPQQIPTGPPVRHMYSGDFSNWY